MRFPSLSLVACLLPAVLAAPTTEGKKDKRSFELRDGVNHTVFYHAATDSTLAFVTNSGICETTPGVNQYSGYLTVGTVSVAQSPETNPTLTSVPGYEYVVLVLRKSKQSNHRTIGDMV